MNKNDIVYEDSDYHTASEFQEDFESDNEPPVDKLAEKKMIYKQKSFRVYKRILRIGKRGYDRPAKYDKIKLRYQNVQQDFSYIEEIKDLQLEEVDIQLGKTKGGHFNQEYFSIALSSMKKNELAIFEIEKLYFTEKKDRKLDEKLYFVLELVDWLTIIDVYGDHLYYKLIFQKGKGIHRIEITDEICCKIKLMNSQFDVYYQQDFEDEKFQNIKNQLWNQLQKLNFVEKDTFLNDIFTNLKINEKIALDIYQEDLKLDQQTIGKVNQEFFNNEKCQIQKDSILFNTRENSILIYIEINHVSYFEDVFMNQTCVKKVKNTGYSTAKPEELSTVFFDYSININKQEIYTTFKDRKIPTQLSEMEFYEENEYFNGKLQEYRFSKALEKTLDQMKKFENSELIFKKIDHLKRGEDYQIIKKYFEKQKWNFNQEFIDEQQIKIYYNIKLWFFNEGHNSFSLEMNERKSLIEKKKQIAIKFLKQEDFKKALKMFGKCHLLATSGVFDQDKKNMEEFAKNALLNQSLCYWKLKDWHKMHKSSLSVLELEKNNLKAIFRGATALYQLEEYENAFELIKKFSDFEKNKELNSLYQKIRVDYQQYKMKEKDLFSKMFKNKDVIQLILYNNMFFKQQLSI